MQIIVADTSPVRYLAEIGHLDLLPRLFETIIIPSVVYEELQHPAAPQSVRAAVNPPPQWLRVLPIEVVDDPVLMDLDDGEKAALTLGLSLKADLILIDERRGAEAARIKGLEFTGTLGILVRAAQRQWIDLAEAFAQLRQTNFYCSEDLMRRLPRRHGGYAAT